MRLLLYIDNLGSGGAQRQLVGLASFLSKDGHDVLVLTYHDFPYYVNLLADGVQYVCLEDKGNGFLRMKNLIKVIKTYKPLVIISYLRSPSICACITKMLGFYKGMLIVSERSLTLKCDKSEKMKFFFYRFANRIVTNSYAQFNYIRGNHPSCLGKSVVIPNFVDLCSFSQNKNDTARQRNIIIVVASLYYVKNAKRLIRSATELRRRGEKFIIKWFGVNSREDPYFNECNKEIIDAGIEDSFILLDKSTSIAEEYKKADYFCLPSIYEGTSNALCEAMASGLPVACSNVGDNGRYVKDGETGFLFDPYDTDSMTKALKCILDLSDSDYREYSDKCRAIAESNWSSTVFLERYKALFER